jgi:hypothetical protein
VRPLTEPPSSPQAILSGSNIRVNQDATGGDQNETVIDVNPLDPLNLVAGANDYRTGAVKGGFSSSLDGGATWVDGVLPESTYWFQGDPIVSFCADGSVVYYLLSFNGAPAPHGHFLYRSTDGGRTWPEKRTALNRPGTWPYADKPWMACDRTPSIYANRVYASWTEMLFDAAIFLQWSADFGATWSGPMRISEAGDETGSVIAIGPEGEVYVSWSSQGRSRIAFDRSTDGGATFGPDILVALDDPIDWDPVFKRNSYPTMDVDRTSGPNRGNIYIAWADDRYGEPDVLLSRSTDGGDTWSEPLRVNDDALGNGADQWFPWLVVDPEGRVIVTFHDRRRNPGDRPYEFWGAVSRDGGQTFDTNFLVSDVASNGSLNGFIGDYSGITATSGYLYPLWCDLRAGTGESDIYTDRFPNMFAYDEVRNLRFTDPDSITFDTQDARFGVNILYDLVWGYLSELREDGGFAHALCLIDELDDPPAVDSRVPPASDGYYYLVRSSGPGGVGTYGDGTPANPNVRDPLDESLVTCP